MKDINIVEFKDSDLDEVANLFSEVWGLNFEEVRDKTEWAFIKGFSLCLLAKNQKNEIIAVRGGFKWPLLYKNKNMSVYQLHGTCVHKDYRRRGVFSKLVEAFIESNKISTGAIFNVSVKESRLGYEKLGWKYLKGFERLTLFNKPFQLISNYKSLRKKPIVLPGCDYDNFIIEEDLLNIRKEVFSNFIHTDYSSEFVKWRLDNKSAGYKKIESTAGCIVYKSQIRGELNEVIIGEVFMRDYNIRSFKNILKVLVSKENPSMIYTYIHKNHPCYIYYIRSMFFPNPLRYNLHFGTRSLVENFEFQKFYYDENNWALSYMDIDTF